MDIKRVWYKMTTNSFIYRRLEEHMRKLKKHIDYINLEMMFIKELIMSIKIYNRIDNKPKLARIK